MKIEERVLLAGADRKATIRFLGEIEGEYFVGIEYDFIDEAFKGKYNGSYKGVEYFSCPEFHGAFVKEKKLLRSLEALIVEKYSGERLATEVMELSDGMLEKNIEFEGLAMVDRQQSKIARLESVSVEGCGFIDNFEKLRALIPACSFLDLSGNNMDENVLLVFKHLPRLQCLDISGSCVRITEDVIAQLLIAGIQRDCSLFLNEICGDGAHILNVLGTLPFVHEILFNNVEMDVEMLTGSLNLRSLELNYCMTSMELDIVVDLLRKFPNLESLSLAGSVKTKEMDELPVYSTHLLNFLNMAKGVISLGGLFQLKLITPNLQSFRISEVEDLPDEVAANLIIGLFGETIQYFNAGEVKERQIPDCEIYLCNFLIKQRDFQLMPGDIFKLICKHKLPVPEAKCTLLTAQERMLVEIIVDPSEQRENEDEAVKSKFNGRVIKVKYGAMQILMGVITPMWELREILSKYEINATEIICEGRKETLRDINKYEELRNIVSGFVCSVE